MNENIDVLLTTAKVATHNNPWAHLATQTISMGYNASMLWYYNNQLSMAQTMGPGYLTAEQVQAMKQDLIKHTAILMMDSVGLVLACICSLQRND